MDFSFEYDTQQSNGFFEDLEQVFIDSNLNKNSNTICYESEHHIRDNVNTVDNGNDSVNNNENCNGYDFNPNDFDCLTNEDLLKDISFSNEEKIPFDLETSLSTLSDGNNGEDIIENSFQLPDFPDINLNLESNELDLNVLPTQLPNKVPLLQETNGANESNCGNIIKNSDDYDLTNFDQDLIKINIEQNSNSNSISSTNSSKLLSSPTLFDTNSNSKIKNNNQINNNNKIKSNNNNKTKSSNKTKNNNKSKNNNKRKNNNNYRIAGDEISNIINNNKKPNPRKRRLRNTKSNKLKRTDSYIIESGKEVFKLLTGQLWVISGGAPQKVLTPYTKELAKNIGNVFTANKLEIDDFQSQLKYLLSNSRRTFTEFILEVLISVLSLHYSTETTPEITIKFRRILKDVITINKNPNSNTNTNTKRNTHKKNGNNKGSLQDGQLSDGKQNKEPESTGIKLQLEQIYNEIFTQDVLMYWFDKRFIDRLSSFFPVEEQQKFFSKHLFFLGKSKFILTCLLIAKDLIKPHGIVEQYHQSVNLKYDGNTLNLYCNNRGKKLKLVKKLITKYSLNNGNYWSVISKDYISRIKFTIENICQFSPFKQIFENNKLVQLSKKNNFNHPHKKRTLASKDNEVQVQINVDWLTKTGVF
ncbi:hypothetical protein M0813_16735 [Anaeramoeba flamelloides]|uniref:Uncharacterized protein n=1 Tax=Anaeramoeba flamelloides TaxID=1746091 RepID=A0ABQ8YYV2_9EUKA|nr:hypothetical protein M0813_16735 [Anaeramoeba flamelloides]